MVKKVLIIEDEEVLLKNLQVALEEKYEVLVATNGKEGLAKAQTNKPDLIILDIMLPDVNGLDVLRQLKEDEKTNGIKVIVSTNLGDKETISKILAAGGKEYIIKSDWKMKDIVEKVVKTIGE